MGLNLVLKRIGDAPYWRRGAIDRQAIDATANELITEFDIRTPSPETSIGKLCGGNIQKALLARELSFGPRVVVFNKPTHGLDVRTIAMVRERIRALAARGVATIVISTDLDELVDLCDRVAVLFAGRIAGIVANGPGAETRIGELIVGGDTSRPRRGRRSAARVGEPIAARIEEVADSTTPRGRWARPVDSVALSVGPILLAMLTCGILLAAIGRDPVAFLRDTLDAGVFRASGCQTPSRRMAPILLIGPGLIVAFRGSLWNLGGNGQYLLAFADHRRHRAEHLGRGAHRPGLDRGGSRGDGHRRGLDPRALAAQGALRPQRDRDLADDVVHRRQPRQPAGQGPVPGLPGDPPDTRRRCRA